MGSSRGAPAPLEHDQYPRSMGFGPAIRGGADAGGAGGLTTRAEVAWLEAGAPERAGPGEPGAATSALAADGGGGLLGSSASVAAAEAVADAAAGGGAGGARAAAVATPSGRCSFLVNVNTVARPIAPSTSKAATATRAPRFFGSTGRADGSPVRLMPEAVPIEAACATLPMAMPPGGIPWTADSGSADARPTPAAARSASVSSCAETKRPEGSRAHAR